MGNSPVVVWNKLHSFKAPSPIEKGISYLLCQKVDNVAQKKGTYIKFFKSMAVNMKTKKVLTSKVSDNKKIVSLKVHLYHPHQNFNI